MIWLLIGLILGLFIGFFIGGVTVIKSLEQNGYYFRRVKDRWVMWYRHPDTEQLVKHEGYSDVNNPTT